MMRCRVNYLPIPRKIFKIVRPVSAVRPSSVNDNFMGEGGCYTILGCEIKPVFLRGMGTIYDTSHNYNQQTSSCLDS